MILGIDLGTTNSLVGLFEDTGPRLLRNALGDLLTEDVIRAAGVDPQARAETLGVAQFAALARALPAP